IGTRKRNPVAADNGYSANTLTCQHVFSPVMGGADLVANYTVNGRSLAASTPLSVGCPDGGVKVIGQ
ncbi:MAG: hypothetical protein V2I38_05350, partial [Alcanivoracaceae bacterium]|nr:hypothetical protein [Alcanivoracaceae bacterium]